MSNITDTNERDIAKIPEGLSDRARDRLIYGRLDWRDSDWQDHCGDLDCDDCSGYIPDAEPHRLSEKDKAVRNHIIKESPNA